jgi:hypothetical protein
VGVGNASKVVVPPPVRATYSEAALRESIRGNRELGTTMVGNLNEMRSIVGDAFNEFGLRVVEDGAGRLRPPAG